MPNRKTFLLLLLSAFLFRLAFGLLRSQIWEIDQFQTYLIGLKCFTTHSWPFFGPDVNGLENKAFQSQIPGAMEGLLIGLPFFILPIPEAPFILLNILSVIGVALLTWYIVKRIPSISYIWLFLWISIVPWSIHESTTIINPAFTFLPAILFFIGFMESLPLFSLNLISPFWANAAMGFSLCWIMQFHFSYVYLIPLALVSLAVQLIQAKRPMALVYFVLGCLPTFAFIIPTYVQYGLARNNVSSGFVVPFNWINVREFWTLLARFLSLVCFELPRFLGIDTKSRISFLTDHFWLFIPGAILWIVGLVQPFVLLIIWCRQLFKNLNWLAPIVFIALFTILGFDGMDQVFHPWNAEPGRVLHALWVSLLAAVLAQLLAYGLSLLPQTASGPRWKELNWMMAAIFVMIYASFWFTSKLPLSHIYFVFFPLLMTYSCYAWLQFPKSWKLWAKVFIVLGVVFQFGYAITVAPRDSIYTKRDVITKAIQDKDYRVFGERREGSLY
ncbi:MAG TPA: hypothetical protein VK791_10285 [bacterium]|jgi:hypothetical protein|nr:hypothetical protein [bacterium]